MFYQQITMRVLQVIIVTLCLVSLTYGFNFNIFRWPTFNRYKKVPRPLQGLSGLKSQAFTGLRNIKGPIVRGIRNFYNFKKNIFNQLLNKGGGSSSYYRQPASSYGSNNDNNNNGFFEISSLFNKGNSAPSTEYGAPQSPSTSYGAPQSPSTSYGAPQSPASSYGAPQSPSTGYGAPQSPSTGYGAPQSPSTGFGVPQSPSTGYGAPQGTSNLGAKGSGTGGGYGGQTGGGFSPSAQINNQGTPIGGTGYSGSGTGNLQPQPLQNTYSNTGQQGQQQLDNNYEINAPLSAAMAMGHLLNEEEIIGPQAPAPSAQWRPIFGQTGSNSIGNTGFGNLGTGNNGAYGQTGLGGTGIGSTGLGSTGLGSTGLGATGIGSTGGGFTGIGSTGLNPTAVAGATGSLNPRPVGTGAGDSLLIGDEGKVDVAGEALSHVVDSVLQVVSPNQSPVGNSLGPVNNNIDVGLSNSNTGLANQDSLLISNDNNGQYSTPANQLQPSSLIRGNSFSLNNNINNNNNNNQANNQNADQLLIGNSAETYSNNDNTGSLARNIQGSPQENSINPLTSDTRVVRQGNSIAGETSSRDGSIMFAGLMEELQLNALTTLIRRANLEAMLTTEGKKTYSLFYSFHARYRPNP